MSTNVVMPALGMAQDTGKVLRWHKTQGQAVAAGEPLLEIETDKVTVTLEAPASGILSGVRVADGDDVPVGQVIAVIQAPGEAALHHPGADPAPPGETPGPSTTAGSGPLTQPPPTPRVAASPVAARIAAEHNVDVHQVAPPGSRIRQDDVLAYLAAQERTSLAEGGRRRVPASPKARRLAAQRGIDLALLAGTGPGGAVLATDVLSQAMAVESETAVPAPSALVGDGEAADERDGRATASAATSTSVHGPAPTPRAAPAEAAEAEAGLVRPSAMGRLMAERTTQSFRETPHFYLTRELPAGALLELRARLLPLIEARTGVRLSFTDLFIRILAQALDKHPLFNACWQDDAIRLQPQVNVGVAAATPQGLLVPVIRDAANKDVTQIARERANLARRAVAGTLGPDDLAGSTVTLSNLGMYDVDMFQAIINPPHSLIVAIGRIAERPVARNGALIAAHTFWLTASFDHRVHDGTRAAEFLRTCAALVEEPLGVLVG